MIRYGKLTEEALFLCGETVLEGAMDLFVRLRNEQSWGYSSHRDNKLHTTFNLNTRRMQPKGAKLRVGLWAVLNMTRAFSVP